MRAGELVTDDGLDDDDDDVVLERAIVLAGACVDVVGVLTDEAASGAKSLLGSFPCMLVSSSCTALAWPISIALLEDASFLLSPASVTAGSTSIASSLVAFSSFAVSDCTRGPSEIFVS